MKLDTYNQEGVKTGTYEAPDNLFSLPQNNALLYQVYTAKWALLVLPFGLAEE